FVPLVHDHLEARVTRGTRTLGRRVLGAVVDDVDPVDERRHASNRVGDQQLLVVRRDDDRDALALEHPAEDVTGGGGGRGETYAARRARTGDSHRDVSATSGRGDW